MVRHGDGVKLKVKLIPRNGLGNRLQAITSAILLSEDIGGEVKILWGKESLLPLNAEEVFSQSTLTRYFDTNSEAQINRLIKETPQFLSTVADEIFLRGNRLGEQKFMRKIKKLLTKNQNYQQMTIIAGGQFELDRHFSSRSNVEKFQERRHLVYNDINFTEEINSEAEEMLRRIDQPYIALHLRGTDRAHQAIPDNLLVQQCIRKSEILGVKSFLILGDLAERIVRVSQLFQEMSITPQISPVDELARNTSSGAKMAILDWLLLKNAVSIVASKNSTFAIEASVAGGTYEESLFLQQRFPQRAQGYLKDRVVLVRKFGRFPI